MQRERASQQRETVLHELEVLLQKQPDPDDIPLLSQMNATKTIRSGNDNQVSLISTNEQGTENGDNQSILERKYDRHDLSFKGNQTLKHDRSKIKSQERHGKGKMRGNRVFEETMSSRETERDIGNQESQEGASEYGNVMRGNAVISKFNHTTVVKVDKILTQNNLAHDNFEREDGSQYQLPFLSSPMKPKADESIRQS